MQSRRIAGQQLIPNFEAQAVHEHDTWPLTPVGMTDTPA
jgi:hypothetical protein